VEICSVPQSRCGFSYHESFDLENCYRRVRILDGHREPESHVVNRVEH